MVGSQPVGEMLPLAVNPFWANLDPKIFEWPKDFFVYGTDFTPINAGVTLTRSIQIRQDSHFLIMAGVRTVFQTNDETVIANPAALVRILDSGSGREIQNRAVQIENLFGTGQLPAYWPYPKIVLANSTIEITLTNQTAGTNYHVRLDFLGFKLFKGQGYALRL